VQGLVIEFNVANDGIRVINQDGSDVNILGSVRRQYFSIFAIAFFGKTISTANNFEPRAPVDSNMN
jgi:hypothetical protein